MVRQRSQRKCSLKKFYKLLKFPVLLLSLRWDSRRLKYSVRHRKLAESLGLSYHTLPESGLGFAINFDLHHTIQLDAVPVNFT